jgi:3-dehydroquinate dehydratase-2
MLRKAGSHPWSIGLIHARRRRASWWGNIKSSEELLGIVTEFGREHLGVSVVPFTSESEPELVDYLFRSKDRFDAFLVNPATFTTYGQGFRSALEEVGRPYVEVHFANLNRWFLEISPQQPLHSIFTHNAKGMMMGLRHYTFLGALLSLVLALDDPTFLHPSSRGATPANPAEAAPP